ncbi:unnamed protein product [Arabis nemorensis]|uniref:Uncharacterized protein n=1 Tax=Arabis nemorensis TaxID=586526 RepID=A0A565BJE3_9BRAS|nr:unnamed protein product [Arabis nemorensis]
MDTEANPRVLSKRVLPKLLKESAGNQSCCIFRISHRLRRINGEAYDPDLLSIGPYHHGKKQLRMIEEHKPRFLGLFLEEAGKNGVAYEELSEAVSSKEEAIRSCYSEDLVEFDGKKLIDMMILDGCFILMLFFIISRKVDITVKNDPIFKMPWVLPTIHSDLLLLENQVPLFLLETLVVTSKISAGGGLNKMVFKFFSYSTQLPETSRPNNYDIEAKHLLDLIRQTFIPYPYKNDKTLNHISLSIPWWRRQKPQKGTWGSDPDPFLRLITSASRLQNKGIVLKPRVEADTWLDIKLKRGVLEIPPLVLDGFIGQVFLNFVAFEQFYGHCPNHITSYVAFMGCLMNNEADARFLREKGIMENYFETDHQVSRFFKNIGKDASFDISRSYLAEVFEGVNKQTSKEYRVRCKELAHTFFGSPWTSVASCAALLLLGLTMIQTFFAVYSYFRNPYPQ